MVTVITAAYNAGATIGAAVGGPIAPLTAAIGGAVGFIGGGIYGHLKEEKADKALANQENQAKGAVADQNFFNEQADVSNGNWHAPMMEGGGVIQDYAGQSHMGPNGGIPIDSNGRPSTISGNNPSALVEDGEISWNGYVFSDKLKSKGKRTFASEAKKIMSKYKPRLGKDFEHDDDMASKAMEKELSVLASQNEEVRIAKNGNDTGNTFGGGGLQSRQTMSLVGDTSIPTSQPIANPNKFSPTSNDRNMFGSNAIGAVYKV
jgi:hypothetical protein